MGLLRIVYPLITVMQIVSVLEEKLKTAVWIWNDFTIKSQEEAHALCKEMDI